MLRPDGDKEQTKAAMAWLKESVKSVRAMDKLVIQLGRDGEEEGDKKAIKKAITDAACRAKQGKKLEMKMT